MNASSAGAPRVLLHYSVFNMGGAERSQLRMMRAMVAAGWNVTLLLNVAGGALEPEIPDGVRVVSLRGVPRKGARGFANRLLDLRKAHKKLGELQKEAFDLAIISLQGLSPRIVCRATVANKRVLWIRTDVTQVKSAAKLLAAVTTFSREIDYFVGVSRQIADRYAARFALPSHRVRTIYNFLEPEEMRRQAEGPSPYSSSAGVPEVVTVCRVQDAPKGIFRMLRVHKRLLEQGVRHRWHVVGDGPDRAQLARQIEAEGLTGSMILHGKQDNPYPYIANADLVAVLSNYEGLSGAVNEAKILQAPVIATRFASVEEQLGDSEGGLIVGQDEDEILTGMTRMLSDPGLRAAFAQVPLPAAIADDAGKLDQISKLISA